MKQKVCVKRKAGKYALIVLMAFHMLAYSVESTAQRTDERKFNVHVPGGNLSDAFSAIEKQTGIAFSYDKSKLKTVQVPEQDYRGQVLSAVLKQLLKNTGYTYDFINNNVVVFKVQQPGSSHQQNGIIAGVVLDERGEPLPHANVSVAGLNKTVVANAAGVYQVEVPAGTYTVEASFVYYITKKISAVKVKTAERTDLTITMQPHANELDAVVVTALGIKREEKALGYSVATVQGKQVTDAMSNNWTDALSGKVAGLNLLRSNGGPAGSNRIILRGENSLSGNSEALIVLDGVVISSSSGRATGNGTSYMGDDSPTDYGTSINDLNPNDIESITVLKGPGATALYGARGANGAVVITTKLANPKVKGIGVSFNSNTALERVTRFPDYQNEYGQGDNGVEYYSYGDTEDGTNTRSTSSAWGAKFDGQEFYQFDPKTFTKGTVRTPWKAYPNNHKDFFETGKTFTNTVSLEGGTRTTSARLSYTNVNNTWIIPNTGYKRHTLSLSLNQKITDKLQLAGKMTYTNKASDNLPAVGYNNQTIMYWMARQVPNVDLNWYTQYWIPGQEGITQNHPFSGQIDNPYLIAYEMLNKSNRNTVTGNVQATYSFTEDLSLMVRTTLDMSYDGRSQQRPKDTQKYQDGMYRTQNIFNQEMNSDFLLRYKKEFSQKWDGSFSLGGSTLRNKYQKDEIRAERLFSPGVFNFANSMDVPLAYPATARFGVTSLYGIANIGYDNFLFIDLTGRKDWSSTLISGKNDAVKGFFYPSASLSAVLSDKLALPKYISLLKLRASYAEVGSGGTTPYLTSYVYTSETNFPSGLSNPTSIANAGLRPERTKSIEFGTDIRLFDSRVGIDVAVYQNNTDDQILRVPVERASGYLYAVLNSGEVRNRGLEVTLSGTPFKKPKGGFTWNINATFAANQNKVLSLADSVETLVLQTGPGSRGSIEARVGGNMGDLYGLGYERAPDGQIVYANGYPVKSQVSRLLGNVYPTWKASIGNEFRYRQFRCSFLFDAQFGAKAYSLTHAHNASGGKLKSTLTGRYNGIIGDGVIKMDDGSYRKNDVVAPEIWTYYTEHYTPDNVEANLFSTDFIKWREARFDYTLPAKLVKKLKLQSASVGVYGRDLLIISHWPSFDPEFGTINNGLIQAGFELGQFPATATYGVNINVAF
jgi:TonB-linked SusC/RagA family outer membrane protein